MIKGTYKHSPERLRKMSLAQKGRIVSEKTREKLHLIHKGKHYSPRTEVKKGDIFINRRNRVNIECKICKKIFEVKKSHSKRRKTCSKKCFSQYQSIKKRGVKIHTDEFKQKLRARNWKGGITPENRKIRTSLEIKLWRKACLERDNFTCQKTGQIGGKLVVHHINNFADFPELRTSIENGITLSKEVHIEFHKKYGKRNNTFEQLSEFLGGIISL